ncbi:phosphomannomutase [Thermodesulfobacteriota bacterium]
MDIKTIDLMTQSGIKFGTSGARGLSDHMTDFICYTYTRGFLQYLEKSGKAIGSERKIAIAGDLRPSTDRIMRAVGSAAADMKYEVINCGKIPSPAIALYGLDNKISTVMVTGSHIPDDSNGIKFNSATGEILKDDETGIKQQQIIIDDDLFDKHGSFLERNHPDNWAVNNDAAELYVQRYLNFFSSTALSGKKIGLYQHSAVGRDILFNIFTGLGAAVTKLGYSDKFIPVDTEAIREEDVRLAKEWTRQYSFDAIISTDGDGDRPLISDEKGMWLRGDIAGILCAYFLGSDSISIPVSCNSAAEKCGFFKEVRRTRIGSPYVITSMLDAVNAGFEAVAGYEANGGFLTASAIKINERILKALPTRDAVIVQIGIMILAESNGKTISELVADLPARFTASDRIKNFPLEESSVILARLSSGDVCRYHKNIENVFGSLCGKVTSVDHTDGVRINFENNEVVHLRPSGNAPELRCYNEAGSQQRVKELNMACIDILEGLRRHVK